jgi:GDP-4-dehydro-6-deoxy-D-mannose reductase
LITGATGFAGSFLVERYAERGDEVYGTFRHASEDRSWAPRSVCFQEIDLRQRDAVFELVRSVRPDIIQHLAAQSSVALSWQDPIGTLTDNAVMQRHLVDAALELSPRARVVVVGSCDEYGAVSEEENPVTESQELRPLNPYALSKVVQDLMGYEYFAVRHLPVIRVRPFLQLGPRRGAQFVAGSFACQVAEIEAGMREPVIEVGNIDLRRDFTDVRDMASAYLLIAERGTPGEVYNIASGTAHTLRDMLGVMLRAAGLQAEIRQDDSLWREGEPSLLIGDSSRLRRVTGWVPAVSFEQSAIDTLTYWRERTRRLGAREG